MILGIDHTDIARNTHQSLDSIFDGLNWLELGWDEQYRQSDRLDLHRKAAEAIARNLREMARLKVPIITTITGEGGSGGALAIAVADRVLMLENGVYSVITPEGCASIMWRDSSKKDLAAQALRITPTDLNQLGCIDGIVPEPEGGAHLDHEAAAAFLDAALAKHMQEVSRLSIPQLLESRYEKFRHMAQFLRVEA